MDAKTKSEYAPKKIFISYPHMPPEHTQLVADVRELLEKDGKYKAWFDKDELKVSDDWRAGIVSGLLETDFVLAFLSEHSMRDPGVCRNEISVVLHEKSGDDLLMTALLESEDKTQAPVTVTHIQPVDLTAVEKYYPIDPQAEVNIAEREEWLKAAVEQLVQKMEEGKDIPGNMTILRKTLQPSSYIAEIAQKSAAFEGRAWLFDDIKDWQEDPKGEAVYVLQGNAGVGKSAISAHLSNFRGSVFGIHFCKYNDVSTHSTNNLVRTMAFQLASRNRTYCAKLINALSDEKYSDKKLLNIPGEQLFDELIVALVKGLKVDDTRERRMFIIDGLDEATVNGENAILELISKKFSELPSWLRVLVTSRPEASIVEALPDTYVLNADDERNKDDVASFLRKGLGKVPALANNDDALDKAVTVATDRSDGVMLYASELLRAVGEGYVDPLNPDDFPKGLGSLYLLSLKRHYPNNQQYHEGQPAVADLLELIAGSPMPITERLLMGIGNINADQLKNILDPLHTLLVRNPKPGEHADTIELFHKSFADWLIQDEHEHPYLLNGDGAKTIGEFLYSTFKSIEDQDLNKVSHEFLEDIDTLLPPCLSATASWGEPNDLEALWSWFYNRGRYNAAIVPIERALDIKKERLGEQDLDTLSVMNDLASTLQMHGDLFGALGHQEKVLEARKEALGEEHLDTLTSMHNLASTLRQMWQLQEARTIQERVLDVLTNKDSGSEFQALRLLLTGMSNLALTIVELGDVDQAIEISSQAVELLKRVAGDEHPDTLVAMNNLASSLVKAGELSVAQDIMEQVLEGQKIALGLTHHNTLRCMDLLGSILSKQGQYERASIFQNLALKELKMQLGDEHQSTLTVMGNLALTLYEQKRFDDARQYQEHVSTKLSQTLGTSHPKTLLAMSNLAVTLFELENTDAALELQEQALKKSQRICGEKHPDSINFMQILIAFYLAQGELSKALELSEVVTQNLRDVYGEANKKTLDSVNSLALLLLKCGNLNAATTLFAQTLERCKANLGEAHTETLAIMNKLGNAFYMQREFAKARKLQEEMLEIRKVNFGQEHEATLANMLNLVRTTSAQKDFIGGRRIQKELLDIYKKTEQSNSPKILECKLNIGVLSLQMKEYAASLEYLTELRQEVEEYLSDELAQQLRQQNERFKISIEEGCEDITEFGLGLAEVLQEIVAAFKLNY